MDGRELDLHIRKTIISLVLALEEKWGLETAIIKRKDRKSIKHRMTKQDEKIERLESEIESYQKHK